MIRILLLRNAGGVSHVSTWLALIGRRALGKGKGEALGGNKSFCELEVADNSLQVTVDCFAMYHVGPNGWRKFFGDDAGAGELCYKYYPVVPATVEHEMADLRLVLGRRRSQQVQTELSNRRGGGDQNGAVRGRFRLAAGLLATQALPYVIVVGWKNVEIYQSF
ncbi:hypothetical protein KSP40_PGU020374 [Platanthera guangdongensis]|uniref:Uncharacterized protein n=1 Tax=Platanthera guangdongensis TaxID=2320717 RepID=A0ABR2M8I3_9ASPA